MPTQSRNIWAWQSIDCEQYTVDRLRTVREPAWQDFAGVEQLQQQSE